jgi:L-fuconolactonase
MLPPDRITPCAPSRGPGELTRRDFLQAAGLTATSLAVGSLAGVAAAAPSEAEPPLIVDCHTHVYGSDDVANSTIANPYRPPVGKGTPAQLRAQLAAAGVSFATAVQVSTFYGWDNRFLADTARANADILVGVCTLSPDDPDSPELLERLVRGSNIRGLRSIPGASGRYVDNGVAQLWATADRLGIPVNVNTNRQKRAELEVLARRHPSLKIVLDHCLYLSAGADGQAVLADLLQLSQLPNVYAKLSCVVTGSAESFPFRDMHAPLRRVIAAFGPDRCAWGSDFPCELWCPKATYAEHLRVFTRELGLDAETQRWILGETARRLYF